MSATLLPNLFIGDFAASQATLGPDSAVLCVAQDCQVARDDANYLYVPLLDDLQDDILPHTPSIVSFLTRVVLTENRQTLVHCMHGNSRSVAAVCAFLMHTWRLSFADTYGLIQERYAPAAMARNFQRQLALFGKHFHWDMLADTARHRVYWDARNRQTDESAAAPVEVYRPATVEALFSCGMCRQPLFYDVNVLSQDFHGRDCCSVVATERMAWMNTEAAQEGKLNCGKCKQKLGHFAWHGIKCPGGKWLAPAFIFAKSRIDKRPFTMVGNSLVE